MRVFVFLLLMLCPAGAVAQDAATLVADSVRLNGQDQLIASGNVEVFHGGTSLRAARIIYDQRADELTIEGPIVIRDADGSILTADRATLDPRLENGLLLGARLVLEQQLQLAANQINQSEGRYTQLYKTAATSCQVCGDIPPLWEIRAERVVHDSQEKQLYFDNATLLLRGLPVFWVPQMRLPDPTLDRATGFLIPRQRNTSQLGSGFKLPYFVTLGDHRDITLTPYASPETRTLEFVYRQAFVHGDLRVEGAVSDDTLVPENRSYLFAEADFDLADGYRLAFDIEAVSDPAYLLDYGYSGKDRLDSAIALLKVTDSSLSQSNFTYYQTLRDEESNSTLPPIVAESQFETRFQPGFGGVLTWGGSIDTAYRYSNEDGPDGRDVTRAGLHGNWRRDQVLDSGIVTSAQFGTRADIYAVHNDSDYEHAELRLVPSAALTLRYPLAKLTGAGTSHLIEPTLMLGWAEAYGIDAPNEDSTRSELDRANLFDPQRFTGEDAVETGVQAAVGLTWSRVSAGGTTSLLTFGRIVRDDAVAQFTPSSGLDGATSDWLIGGQITAPGGFIIETRTLMDDDAELTRADNRVAWRNDEVSLSASHIWQATDPVESRFDTVSEWTLDADFVLSDAWSMTMDARYDVAADRPVRAGVGFEWRNECVIIDVSASRRYTSSSTVEPTTTFGLSGTLTGFSTGRSRGGPAAACTK